MAKVKVRVLDAIVGGKGKGEVLTVDEKTADHLESIRYVERVAGSKDDENKDGK